MSDQVTRPAATSSEHQMTTATEILSEAANAAAQLSVDSAITAKEVIATAAAVAMKEKDRQDTERDSMKEVLVDALNKVFGEKQEQQQFINVSRIPMICSQIAKIHEDISTINLNMELSLQEWTTTKRILLWFAGIVGSATILALLGAFFSVILKK